MDFRLVKALEIYDGWMTGAGVPIYWDRSDRVVFEAGVVTSKAQAAIDRAEEKAAAGKAKNYGKMFYAIPSTRDGGPLPTLDEFLEEQARKRAMTAGKIRIGSDEFSNTNWEPET